jgi:hypothetical protein
MTAPTLATACPSWCNQECRPDDYDGLHVQDDVLVSGPAHNRTDAIVLRLALTRDDSLVDEGEVRIWLEDYDIGLEQAAEVATHLMTLVQLGRKS